MTGFPVVILISGRGTNLQAIVDEVRASVERAAPGRSGTTPTAGPPGGS